MLDEISSSNENRLFATSRKEAPTSSGGGGCHDNLYDVLFNGAGKVVKDEEVIRVLEIIEEATQIAKEAK